MQWVIGNRVTLELHALMLTYHFTGGYFPTSPDVKKSLNLLVNNKYCTEENGRYHITPNGKHALLNCATQYPNTLYFTPKG